MCADINKSVSRIPSTRNQDAQKPKYGSTLGWEGVSAADLETDRRPLAPTAHWPAPLDLVMLAGLVPQVLSFIVDRWLPAGYATLFSGHGGSGKSLITLFLAVCIALGINFGGLRTERRRVLYLSCEDRTEVLHWRLARICGYLAIDMRELAGWLDIVDLVGHDTVVWIADPRKGANQTAAYRELEARITESESQVVIVDGIADVYGGDENIRAQVKQFVNALLALIDPNDGALLLIGHVSKSNVPSGYSGSTAWHNSVRARWLLAPEMECGDDKRYYPTGRMLLELEKSNLGSTDDGTIAWQWDKEAHLFVPDTAIDRDQQAKDEQQAIICAFRACAGANIQVPAAETGRRTAYHVLLEQDTFPESLRTSKSASIRFRRALKRLRDQQVVVEISSRNSTRHAVSYLVLSQGSQ